MDYSKMAGLVLQSIIHGPTYSNFYLTQMTDNIIDRDELQQKLIEWDLNQMSLNDLREYFVNMQNAELDSLSVDELIEEVKQYNPSLLESKEN